ncbi:amidase [Pseudonocardia parietis]|uniref:Asp-tRNA(Asn)/Glu-tRNA(Gln) amidotransferase A subunit family amidase n=1 Tax=Pseudonocardia parietis TaxID=570936 RepID=A0ABS4W5Z2_9PSEU|nr:amidase family protein [Pseudonocardia parietis]MBP2371627.1 Asp-tRNA(Asn)/Glu-tRNA(Gln) amidotransferase A subunit family amidase [Pseudonocardia parietis]
MTTDLPLDNATALRVLVAAREVSPVEIVREALDRAKDVDADLNLFVTVTEELALASARAVEQAVMSGEDLGPLAGVPITVKDNLNVAGVPTRSGSTATPDAPVQADSPAVARARQAGACILGKTTTSEFAIKAVGQSPLTGITRNPWNPQRTTGGSSAGGAAAVAAGVVPLSVVTDGGGSTRIPASLCGVFGIKPQFGRVPYLPVSATPTLSHVGCVTFRVRDALLALRSVAGPDARDAAAPPIGPIGEISVSSRMPTLRVALCPDLGGARPRDDVRAAVDHAAGLLRDRWGCSVESVADVVGGDSSQIFYSEFLAGAGARLAPLLSGSREQLDPDVVSVLEHGANQTLTDYMEMQGRRHALRARVHELFERFDVLVTPTVPVTAFGASESCPAELGLTADDPFGWLPYTYPFNLTGNPAASIPCGTGGDGLPIGMQVVGRPYDEATVLTVAAAMESTAPWSRPADDLRKAAGHHPVG